MAPKVDATDCVEFSICITERPGTKREKKRWLTPARKWTDNQAEALVILMRRTPTMGERQKIDDDTMTIAGGPKKWLERNVSEGDLWVDCLNRYRRALWPDGQPEPDTDEEEAEQGRQLEDAFARDNSPAAAALRMLRTTNGQARMIARWPVLVVSPPEGWESIRDLPDEPMGLIDMLVNAYEDAVATAERTQGN